MPELHKKWEHTAFGPAVARNGASAAALSSEPPALHEFEPGHLVAEAE
ncbi:MAG: hypothetical protein ACXVW7_00055 [Trebonia sp.]